MSDAHKQAALKRWKNKDYRKKQSLVRSKLGKSRWADPKFRKKIITAIKKKSNTRKRRAAMSLTMQEVWTNDEFRRNVSRKISKAHNTKEYKLNRSKIATHMWKHMSEETRENISKKLSIATSINMKERWKDTEYRKRRNKNASTTMRMLYATGILTPSHTTSDRYKCGWVGTKKGGRMYCHSSWEFAFIEILDSAKIVRRFVREPFVIQYKYKGKEHSYFPDFLVELRDGRKFVVEIKGTFSDKNIVRAKFKAASKWCENNGYEWVVITEKPLLPVTNYLQ